MKSCIDGRGWSFMFVADMLKGTVSWRITEMNCDEES
jgi:hypothetical protein